MKRNMLWMGPLISLTLRMTGFSQCVGSDPVLLQETFTVPLQTEAGPVKLLIRKFGCYVSGHGIVVSPEIAVPIGLTWETNVIGGDWEITSDGPQQSIRKKDVEITVAAPDLERVGYRIKMNGLSKFENGDPSWKNLRAAVAAAYKLKKERGEILPVKFKHPERYVEHKLSPKELSSLFNGLEREFQSGAKTK